MDYKQKIKEYLNSDIDVLYKNMLLNLFPELKESEDEKIRNWLIGYFRQYKEDGMGKYANGLKVDSIVAWLEKQGEHNPAWSEEDEINYNYALAACIYYGEAKGYADTETHQKANNWLKSLKERVQPKPNQDWSEEDEEFLSEIISDIKSAQDKHPDSQMNQIIFDEEVTWLKSLKDRYTWKPSDEQMAALSDINCTGCISYAGQGQELINLFNELKKLKG